MLDLVFTTNQTLLKSMANAPGLSDHIVITDFCVQPFQTCQASQKCHLFGKANWEALSDYVKQQQRHLRRQWSFLTQGGEGRSWSVGDLQVTAVWRCWQTHPISTQVQQTPTPTDQRQVTAQCTSPTRGDPIGRQEKWDLRQTTGTPRGNEYMWLSAKRCAWKEDTVG